MPSVVPVLHHQKEVPEFHSLLFLLHGWTILDKKIQPLIVNCMNKLRSPWPILSSLFCWAWRNASRNSSSLSGSDSSLIALAKSFADNRAFFRFVLDVSESVEGRFWSLDRNSVRRLSKSSSSESALFSTSETSLICSSVGSNSLSIELKCT